MAIRLIKHINKLVQTNPHNLPRPPAPQDHNVMTKTHLVQWILWGKTCCPYIDSILCLNGLSKNSTNKKWEEINHPIQNANRPRAQSLHQMQRRMANKEDGGKIDGKFNKKGQWIVDTDELHADILSAITSM